MAQFIPLIVMAVGQVMQTAGEMQQADATANAHEFNSEMLKTAARSETNAAAAREEQLRTHQREFLGQQRAAFAQSGAGLTGSAADVMRQSAVNAELDAMNTRYEGELQAWSLRGQATQEKFAGRTAKKQKYYAASSSILSAAGKYFGSPALSGGV